MPDTSSNNKRIAKNTLLLYVRMLFLMLVSLYTSRVILNALGVEDYGIYNVVGGVVTMFSVLSGSLNAAISRFITYELGAGHPEQLKKIFSSAVTIQAGIALVVIVLAETLGLWFLNNKMVIPENRLIAANWCFQFSVITFSINLISVPYNATIIAHERMSAFAYISILEALGKLLVAWCIAFNPIDRLIFFSALVAVVAWTIRMIYASYCKRHFEECTYHFVYDHDLLKRMFSFAGWNLFGAGSWQLMTQGVNLLVNIYFGVTLNAARGIASKIEMVVIHFVNNFTTAINPQITKSYASGEREYMFNLMFRGAKISYFLLMFFAIPIMLEAQTILSLWLGFVPDHTVNFIRLTLSVSMLHVLSNTMITTMLATGNIKKYQIIVGGLGMMVLPLAWFFFLIDLPPEMAYVSTLIIFILQLTARLILMREMVNMSIKRYVVEVLSKVILVTIMSVPLPLMLNKMMSMSVARLSIVGSVSVATSALVIYTLGLDHTEKCFVRVKVRNALMKLKHR